MKFIRNIIIFILVILGIIGALIGITYDSSGTDNLPTHLYTDDYDAMEMLFTELNDSFEDVEDGTTDDLEFDVSEDILNRFIYEKVLDTNPDYAPSDECSTDEECYIIGDSQDTEQGAIKYHVVGIYAQFLDGETDDDPGKVVLNASMEVDLAGLFTYKTVLQLHFLFEDDETNGDYTLEFEKVQMGSIRVPQSVFTWIINQAENTADVSLEENLGALPVGELDLNTMTYTIDKSQLLSQIGEAEEQTSYNMLSQELLSIMFDRNLLNLNVSNDNFSLVLGVSQISSEDADKQDIPMYLYDLHDTVPGGYGEFNATLFNPTSHLQDIFTQYLFSGALSNGTTNSNFEINEELFNKLIYSNANGFTEARKVQTITISDTETKDIELGLKSIWFEFEEGDGVTPDAVYAHALFRVAGIDSLLVIRADVEYVDVTVGTETITEMHCVFEEITFGQDDAETPGQYLEVTDLQVFKDVFASLGDVEFGEFNDDGDLIISPTKLTGLLAGGVEGDAIQVTSVGLVQDALVLGISAPEYQAVLDGFQDALNDVLGDQSTVDSLLTALNPQPGSVEEDVYNTLSDIQDTLEAGNDVSTEDINDLLDGFVDLEGESQEDMLDTLDDILSSSEHSTTLDDFESIFGQFDDDEEVTEE